MKKARVALRQETADARKMDAVAKAVAIVVAAVAVAHLPLPHA